jgi:hypothetical protein
MTIKEKMIEEIGQASEEFIISTNVTLETSQKNIHI